MLSIGAAILLAIGSARAEGPKNATCWCTQGGGGEIPTPFSVANRTAELADREPYLLFGKLVFRSGLPYLELDFSAHPWLASAVRKADPYYLIESSNGSLHEYEDKTVKVLAFAHVRLDKGHRNSPKLVYSLELAQESGITPVEGGAACATGL